MSPLYVLSLSGTAFERGLTYGKAAREKILKAIAFYSHLFEGMAGISWDKAKKNQQFFFARHHGLRFRGARGNERYCSRQ